MMIYTSAGRIIDPKNVSQRDICAADIAHSLSLMCRACGHFRHFYSVAQHSINCMREARARGFSERVCFAALLHDGSEAYLSDISRPVKEHLEEYASLEERFQTAIYERFGLFPLSEEEKRLVSIVDDACLWYEFKTIHTLPLIFERTPHLASVPDVKCRDMRTVEKAFLKEIASFESANIKKCG